ncbi:MAG: sigma-70 family RNA polymerase sigma factor [Gemmataceae bacterium]
MPTTDLPPATPDHILLERYTAARENPPFAELVARHGRLVFGTCLRILRTEADASDAFQATFLVLMRKSGTFRRGDNLPGWLHTVASRIALRARKRRAAQHILESEAAVSIDAHLPKPEPQWVGDLDEALARLPDTLRMPLTLCYLEGKTGDEAAAELGCSRSTLTRRLTEGRELLRRRLERLGVAVPAAALLTVLEGVASASEPPAAAVAALTGTSAAGVSPAALALAKSFATGSVGMGKLAAVIVTLVTITGVAGWGLFGGVRNDGAAQQPLLAATDPAPAATASPAEPPAGTPAKAIPTPPAASKPVARVPQAPKLPDEQLISSWQWDKFKWQPVESAITRPVNFAITVPPGHKFVTVAVDDADGVRVRNLLDAVEVGKLGGDPEAREPQLLAVQWNGLDDDGRPLPDGTYNIRGCSHPGVRLVYDYSFLNPGTPPWELYPNSGWGGDHGFPHAIACLRGHGGGKWRVAIGGTIAEGGTPAFILDGDDRKIHAFGRGWAGPKAMAAADGQLWVGLWSQKDLLRLEYHTGKQVPFKTAKGPHPTLTFDADVWGIAIGKDRVAVRLHDGKDPKKERVVIFDRDTGENRTEVKFTALVRRNGLVAWPDGRTLVVATDAGLMTLDMNDRKPDPKPLALKGVEKPGPLATDKDGNLYVLDRGVDYRVKVFSPALMPLGEIGAKGGQGDRLEFDPAALHGVEAISVDDDGICGSPRTATRTSEGPWVRPSHRGLEPRREARQVFCRNDVVWREQHLLARAGPDARSRVWRDLPARTGEEAGLPAVEVPHPGAARRRPTVALDWSTLYAVRLRAHVPERRQRQAPRLCPPVERLPNLVSGRRR